MTFDELVMQQVGVVSRAQALACGISARTVGRRVASGAWRTLFPCVYLVAGHRLTDAGEVLAASLWGGRAGTVAGSAAAFWHGLLAPPLFRLDVTLPRSANRRRPPGIFVRRRDLPPEDRVEVRGIAVTSVGLTVLEAAPRLADGPQFLDRALQRNLGFDDLHAAYCRNAGARGMAAAGRMLVGCADRADSGAERRFIGLLRRAGITGFVRGLPFGEDYEIDIAFPDAMLAIEFDGWAWHSDVDRFRNDRRKGNALVAAGWTVLRFTWADLTERPGHVVRQIRDALARAGAA